MAVTIHLARFGSKKTPFYRVVAAHKGKKRDGKYIERLGTYNPLVEPAQFNIKEDRVRYWISVGAKASDVVRRLVIKSIPGLIEGRESNQLKKIQEARKKRKARAAKKK